MTTYTRAREVIEKNKEAVVLFTHGAHLSYDATGNGLTGKWVLKPNRLENIDKVIIYLRSDGEKVNRIYLGNYAGVQPSDLPRRYTIRFTALKEVGTTESNWLEFAKSGQNPVSYIMKVNI